MRKLEKKNTVLWHFTFNYKKSKNRTKNQMEQPPSSMPGTLRFFWKFSNTWNWRLFSSDFLKRSWKQRLSAKSNNCPPLVETRELNLVITHKLWTCIHAKPNKKKHIIILMFHSSILPTLISFILRKIWILLMNYNISTSGVI